MTTKAEELREAISDALYSGNDNIPIITEILAAIVETLGITEEMIMGVDGALWIARQRANDPRVKGLEDTGMTEYARDALATILEAARG